MDGEYHEESYNERMEAEHGPYDNNDVADTGIAARDVDAALWRIEDVVGQWLNDRRVHINDVRQAIAQARRDLGLGLPTEVKA